MDSDEVGEEQRQRRTAALEQELDLTRQLLAQKEMVLDLKDATIIHLQSIIATQKEIIAKEQMASESREEIIENLRQTIGNKDETLANNARIIANNTRIIENDSAIIESKDRVIAALQGTLGLVVSQYPEVLMLLQGPDGVPRNYADKN